MKIQFLGQNCFLFTYKGKMILSDPFYNYQKEKSGFNLDAQRIDYVLITHAHGDHTADVQEVIDRYPDAVVIGQPEVCGYFKHLHNIDINFGGSAKIEDLKISMVPALHTSSFPDGSYGGLAAGYVFRFADGRNLYMAGDTGVSAEMALLPKLFGSLDMAILPVGKHYTMCPRKAAFAAAELLKTQKVLGCHFDTFPSITIDHTEAYRYFEEKGIDFTLPELGQEFDF
ncbi:metal-dependent hydrolase [Riemerella columbipharyngis]|uniref:L-ascorbate metabolism protein UlaG, beta-lactamase superfamily n=1 Tax=Riemerella columbipharyngis TaxID=1071918 RepID=A0A1G7BJ57_9FLAO|nr:metal-dependent hydrolase [Riemerella columbipharyngis]SDE27099.1 L-ascorbate metabolism protein UlaG, beta-lactamase superfamily [Riemerella columbipharyngis]